MTTAILLIAVLFLVVKGLPDLKLEPGKPRWLSQLTLESCNLASNYNVRTDH